MSSSAIKSLRYLYLKGMLRVLLPTLLVGTALSYFYASKSIRDVYDLDLLDDANDLLHQVQVHDSGDLILDLPLAARQMLLANNEENVVYAVWDDNGNLLSGSKSLFDFSNELTLNGKLHFETVNYSGRSFRMIWKKEALGKHSLFIVVAQTTSEINQLLFRVLVGFIFLGVLLTLVAVIGIFFAVRQGLVPVATLRASIAQRSPHDFSLLSEDTAPEELRPIIHGINELLHNLEKSVQDHRRFVADAAHQIRTPLAVLTSKIETALHYSGEKNSALLQQLLAVTQRTSHLTNQLLSLSRIENSGNIEMNLKPINMLEMMREVAASYVILAEKSNIQLDFRLEACEIPGDSLLLQEVLGNLLDNAFRYSGKGSVVIVALHRRASSIELSVCDNGVGVKPEQLEKLGQPFFRGNTTDNEGCGLGLTIVTEIIKLHRGHLSYSIPAAGRGLCVTISLPIHNASLEN